jgi:hypothetical protein
VKVSPSELEGRETFSQLLQQEKEQPPIGMEDKKERKRSKEHCSHTSNEAADIAHRGLDTTSETGSVDAPSKANSTTNAHDDERLPAWEERRVTAQAHYEEEPAEMTRPVSLASSGEYPAATKSYDGEELVRTMKPARPAALEHNPAASTTTERKVKLWSAFDFDTDSGAVESHVAESERPK